MVGRILLFKWPFGPLMITTTTTTTTLLTLALTIRCLDPLGTLDVRTRLSARTRLAATAPKLESHDPSSRGPRPA